MSYADLVDWFSDGSLLGLLLAANYRAALACCSVFVALLLIGRFFTPHIRSLLWLLVFIPLILPFAPPSSLSLYQWLAPATLANIPAANEQRLAPPPPLNTSPSPRNLEEPRLVVAPTPNAKQVTADSRFVELTHRFVVGGLWLAGVLFFLIRMVLQSIQIERVPRSRQPRQLLTAEVQSRAEEIGLSTIPEIIWTSENIPPSLGGFLRPRLILPDWMSTQLSAPQRRLILLHELRHFQSGDLLSHRILSLLVAFHWWNPIARLAHRRWLNERELSCDAWVVAHASPRDFKPYAETLLRIIEITNQRQPLRCPSTIGAPTSLTEHRIMAMKFQQRTTWTGLLIACGTAALIGATTLTNPLSAQNQNERASVPPQHDKDGTSDTSLRDRQSENKIRIVLRLANGDPAGGASVHAKVTPGDGAADRELTADARGIAEVPVPESFKELRLWLETRQPGWVPLFAAWPPRNAKADQQVPEELEFVFPKGTRIGSTIQAADGKPIPEAVVVASILPSRFPPERIARGIPHNPSKGEEALARTDANGRWSMGWIPSGDEVRVSLTVIHQDFIGWTFNESDLAAQGITMADLRDESATLVLPRGHRFHGKVLDAKGKPVPNANIVWDRGEKIGEDIASMIETNNYGRFDLGRVPAGEYTLGVSVNDAPRMEKTVQLTNDDAIIFQLTE